METVSIGTTPYGSHWLEAQAAASWFRMVRDGCPAYGVTDAGRTQQEQINVFLRYFTLDYAASAKFDPRSWNGKTYWRRPGMPSAATPGSYQARHTFGRALDLNTETKAWVRARGAKYGWIKDLVKNEDWHMEYQPQLDVVLVSNPGTSTGNPDINIPGTTPIDPLEDELSAEAERQIKELHALFGAGGAIGMPEEATMTALIRNIHAQTNGLPGALSNITDNVNGIPTVLGEIVRAQKAINDALDLVIGVLFAGTPGTPIDATIYQRIKRIEENTD
jgi:hypothetical protein